MTDESIPNLKIDKSRALFAERGVIVPEDVADPKVLEALFDRYMQTGPSPEEVQRVSETMAAELFDNMVSQGPGIEIKGVDLEKMQRVVGVGAHPTIASDGESNIFLIMKAVPLLKEHEYEKSDETEYQFLLSEDGARGLLHSLFHIIL